MSKHQMILAFGAAALVTAPALAAQGEVGRDVPQLQALLQCRAIASAEDRLRCYDSAAGAFAQATADGSVVVLDQAEIKRTRKSLFGLSLPSLPFLGDKDEAGQDEVESTIASASPADYGKWLITLEDGAVWRTVEADSRSRTPRAGDPVTVKRGSLGRYFITWKGSRANSALRVR